MSEPLAAILPRLADPDRYVATLDQMAKMEGTLQAQRQAQIELRDFRAAGRGTVKPSITRGKQ